ncbi:MAG: tetratricopeptide repeat protein [Sulfurimonadaceae bacterium]|jgi:lipopolysaccharide biosynthesis regulator YciM|nr:tetratricopeptide repeat protein [Sulfurimonadaceae bacterium]
MNSFFIEFRDPLFGIIIFFALIFIIAFFSYWWGRHKQKEDSRHLDKFLRQFRSLPSENELKTMIRQGGLSEKSWLLLASAFDKNGDYEKAIEIYNEILKVTTSDTRDTMYLLGQTYFKAGFLERSKQIFLEILKNNPRTPQALRYLLLIHEYMKEYTLALEVLEPLDELKKDVKLESIYLRSLAILNHKRLDSEEKTNQLLEIYKENHRLGYMIFEYLFRVAPALAWKHFDSSKSERLIDVLWRLPLQDIDFEIVSKNSFLRELYSARGDVNLAESSFTFELDVLIQLEKKASATLRFLYTCDNCKHTYPFVFHRCSHCHSIDTVVVEYTLIKKYHRDFSEENNSFQ